VRRRTDVTDVEARPPILHALVPVLTRPAGACSSCGPGISCDLAAPGVSTARLEGNLTDQPEPAPTAGRARRGGTRHDGGTAAERGRTARAGLPGRSCSALLMSRTRADELRHETGRGPIDPGGFYEPLWAPVEPPGVLGSLPRDQTSAKHYRWARYLPGRPLLASASMGGRAAVDVAAGSPWA